MSAARHKKMNSESQYNNFMQPQNVNMVPMSEEDLILFEKFKLKHQTTVSSPKNWKLRAAGIK